MLKAIQLGQQLTKSEMKYVTGGELPSGTCAAINAKGELFGFTNKATAIEKAGKGGHWCCAHCAQATWLDVSFD